MYYLRKRTIWNCSPFPLFQQHCSYADWCCSCCKWHWRVGQHFVSCSGKPLQGFAQEYGRRLSGRCNFHNICKSITVISIPIDKLWISDYNLINITYCQHWRNSSAKMNILSLFTHRHVWAPSNMIVKGFGCTAVHSKALFKCLIYSFLCGTKIVLYGPFFGVWSVSKYLQSPWN